MTQEQAARTVLVEHATTLIAAERARQVDVEGWSPDHDRQHGAACLVQAGYAYLTGDVTAWPWHLDWWKPKSQFRNTVRAGALALAALDVDPDLAGAVQLHDRSVHVLADMIGDVTAAIPAPADLNRPSEQIQRLRAERLDALTGLSWLAPDVTQDGTLTHAVAVAGRALAELNGRLNDVVAVCRELESAHQPTTFTTSAMFCPRDGQPWPCETKTTAQRIRLAATGDRRPVPQAPEGSAGHDVTPLSKENGR